MFWCAVAGHAIEDRVPVGRRTVMTPSHVLVGSDQHQIPLPTGPDDVVVKGEGGARYPWEVRLPDQRIAEALAGEIDQGEAWSQPVIELAAVSQPDRGRPRTRPGRRGDVTPVPGRRAAIFMADDRR